MARARRSSTKGVQGRGGRVGAIERKQAAIDEKRDPQGPLTSEERAENTRLRRELKTVTMERDFLRKAAALKTS